MCFLSQVYDELVHATIDEYFQQQQEERMKGTSDTWFDGIAIGDVFGYIGDIRSIIRGTGLLLSKQGRLIFTIEASSQALEKGYRLDVKTSRFVHDVGYVHRLMNEEGYVVQREREVTLRYQMRMPVRGILFVCTRTTLFKGVSKQ